MAFLEKNKICKNHKTFLVVMAIKALIIAFFSTRLIKLYNYIYCLN